MQAEGVASSRSRTFWASVGGHDDPQVDHRRSVSAAMVARARDHLGSGRAHRLPPAPPARRGRTRRRSATSPPRTSTATSRRRRRPGSPSSASPSTSTASARRSSSGATRSGRNRPLDDLDAYCEFVRSSPSTSMGVKPEASSTMAPVIIVVRCGVLNRGWIAAAQPGSSPSLAIE